MSRRISFQLTLSIGLLLSCLFGCRSNPPGRVVPKINGLTDAQILEVLADRSNRVQHIMSSGTMQVEADGKSVKLDIALLASGDRQLRLRAWKLSRAVFDLTRDGDDLWIWHAEQDDETQGTTSKPQLPNLRQLSTGWRLASSQVFTSPPDELTTGDPLVAAYRLSSNETSDTTARFMIDRDTQTVTRIEVDDAENNTHAIFEPSRYRLVDGIPWPTQLVLRSDDLELTITLDSVELNGVLTASAFRPPRNARKLP